MLIKDRWTNSPRGPLAIDDAVLHEIEYDSTGIPARRLARFVADLTHMLVHQKQVLTEQDVAELLGPGKWDVS